MIYDVGYQSMDAMFVIIFIIVIGGVIAGIAKGIGTWNSNNHSPKLTVDAEIVTKRMEVHHTQHANAGDATGASGFHTTTTTRYYVTFQVESGDRMEFTVHRSEYGMMAEGDRGKLTFQGTRYLGFDRSID